MPNWCVNQLHIDGPDSDAIIELMTQPKPQLHQQASRAAAKLFLAGVGGLLKPTYPMSFELYPDLVREVGSSTPENRAFTKFVTLMKQPNVVLNDEVCQWILALFEESGLKQRCWGDLPKVARKKIAPLLKKQASDWTRLYFSRLALDILWTKLDLPEPASETESFSLRVLVPPTLLVELNGFNGGLFAHDSQIPSGYCDNVDQLGTKWEQVSVDEIAPGRLEFETAWSPASPAIAALASRFPNTKITHYFAESGCAFAGYVHYVNGMNDEEICEDMVFSEQENEDGYCDVEGPDYLLRYFSRYGG
ncbi:DUF1281 domain-containing protein [uncultured Vibrio sp.]|uniref:DUF1281 domain-containing protein n=1 Tax=uncultured Vibrio sp. TaxID=114054 RepID=UPI00261FD51F|nr:DUF1281 domain-containing protein [uncultured Vibrio sp.]